MVNAKRVVKKLPALLCDGDTSRREGYNAFMRYRFRLSRLKRRSPERFNTLTVELVGVLEKIDQALQEVSQKR
ncbi:hypothetical protein G4O51_08520 [Candidatus Bathyarchaeota archaeon A05DMB-2]|jgi:hypothetical protein|nr:hypothetical protein [Candidatus Bathyarchaeota archaeon A05DMB-2]